MLQYNVENFKPVLIYGFLPTGNRFRILLDLADDIFSPRYYPPYTPFEYSKIIGLLGPKYMVLNMRRVFELSQGVCQQN